MNIILKKPIISEKSMKLTGSNLYTFLVDRKARKQEIAKIITTKFGVDVLSVKTANYKAQTKMQKRKRKHYTIAAFKKALVELKEGQKIGLFETQTEPEVITGEEEKEVKVKKSLLKGTTVKIEGAKSTKNIKGTKGKKEKEEVKDE